MFDTNLDLMPNEEMILASNPHWMYFWKEVIGGLIIVGVLILMLLVNASWIDTTLKWLMYAGIVVILISLGFRYANWKTTRFAITTERVAYQSGMFRRRGVSIPLNRVNNVNFNQSVIARMFNNGVVTIESAGETGDSVFENIPDPQKVRALIFAQVEADEQRDSDRDAAALAKAMQDKMSPPTAASSAQTTPQERLAQLDALRSQGLVNDAEYATKRQQILDEL
ncbi:MAG: PH domain-containing protein [Ilumatobacteraceae bacterium]